MLPITKREITHSMLCDHSRNDKMWKQEPNQTLMSDGKCRMSHFMLGYFWAC